MRDLVGDILMPVEIAELVTARGLDGPHPTCYIWRVPSGPTRGPLFPSRRRHDTTPARPPYPRPTRARRRRPARRDPGPQPADDPAVPAPRVAAAAGAVQRPDELLAPRG